MYGQLFKFAKKLVPRISSTELIALQSGTTSLDRQIFQGEVKLPRKKDYRVKNDKFIQRNVRELLYFYNEKNSNGV